MRPMVVPSIYSNCAASHHDGCIFIPFCSLFLCLVLHLFLHLSIIFANFCAQVCVLVTNFTSIASECSWAVTSNWTTTMDIGMLLKCNDVDLRCVPVASKWKKYNLQCFLCGSSTFALCFMEKAISYVKEAHFRSEKIESILLSTEKCSISMKKWIRIPMKTKNK